ncbi:hypothetical protein PBCV1_a138aR [Paramecium bursaria Chlorella virus 1]|uniref:Uncharacterized protein n=1 Tax=Paramecium bursaria Chlorella virus 1 TaxID=10506 RepID=F8TTY5_PBCV1|nr:hypothetical protein PBCV1_a138aR [Paramecium bursaria Chlorella virus 1]AEI70046.1 hypothetical protein [Paramecium bursaria Chlorella virus 1]
MITYHGMKCFISITSTLYYKELYYVLNPKPTLKFLHIEYRIYILFVP